MLEPLPNDGSTPGLHDTGADKKTAAFKITIAHPFRVFLKVIDFPFACLFITSRQGHEQLDGGYNVLHPAVVQFAATLLGPLVQFFLVLPKACLGNVPIMLAA